MSFMTFHILPPIPNSENSLYRIPSIQARAVASGGQGNNFLNAQIYKQGYVLTHFYLVFPSLNLGKFIFSQSQTLFFKFSGGACPRTPLEGQNISPRRFVARKTFMGQALPPRHKNLATALQTVSKAFRTSRKQLKTLLPRNVFKGARIPQVRYG